MKIYIQTSFEQAFEELLIETDLQLKKVGYDAYIKTQVLDYCDGTILVKRPQTNVEKGIENFILTLELLYQLPISFDGGQWVEYDLKKYLYDLYKVNVTDQTEHNLNFMIYTSLLDTSGIDKISEFAKSVKEVNINIAVEIVAIPSVVGSVGDYDSDLIYNNLKKLSKLKESNYFSNVYFIDAFDEECVPNLWDVQKISNVCSDLLLSKSTILSDNDVETNGNICSIGIQRLEIDKFFIINNWAINIFRKLCHDVVGEDNKETDIDKVNQIYQNILEEEKKGLEMINNLPDNQVSDFLGKWKDELMNRILNKIICGNLNNSEKELLLSYFRNIRNRDLLKLEEFDFDKLSLFDSLYITFVDKTIDKENPYQKLKEIILQIQKIKKDMEERQRRINETRDLIDNNYRRDGKWTDGGYQIGNDVFKIQKNDGLKDNDISDELFTDYEPSRVSSLPKSANLKTYFPPIKNQKQLGACSSFSLTSVFEYCLSNELQKYSDMSEAFVYYNGRANSGNTNKDSGANLYDVIKGMADKGVCIEELCKYDPEVYNQEPSPEAYADGKKRKVTSAKRVAVNENTIKAAINDGYPVVACFRAFQSWQENTSGFIPMPTESERKEEQEGFHAMVICGYNDKHGHFIVRNSWGTDFGDNGYCYLPYSYVRDTDLTRYAVAITRINAKDFVKHNPIKDVFDFNKNDKNIQYAIHLNLLKEDEHQLSDDRIKVKELIDELRKLIDEIKSKDDIEDYKGEIEDQLEIFDKQKMQIEGEISKISIWDNKIVHIIHGVIFALLVGTIVYGIYKEEVKIWGISTAMSLVVLTSWIISMILSKRNRKKFLKNKLDENEKKQEELLNRIDQKRNIRDRVIKIINATDDIDDISSKNRELLNQIILILNNCYSKISDYLNNNSQLKNEKDKIVHPDWFNELITDYTMPDLIRQILSNNNGKDLKKVLFDFQKNILVYFEKNFDKRLSDCYDKSLEWNKYVRSIIDNKVYAKFKDSVNPLEITERSWFLSDLYMPNIQVNSNYIRFDRNRYIYLHIKEALPDWFDLKS